MSYELCPHCGADLLPRARACRECGSDERTGWKSQEDVDLHSVDLPSDEDYDDFLEREGLAPGKPGRTRRPKIWIVVTAIVLLGALVFSFVLI